ncbi:MAG: preprotein translocase subunit SecE [Candidatus Omnitrophota bacterium]|jgi:preprotein translocase subunit SecE
MKVFSKAINFIKEVRLQLIKVSWPTKTELVGATTVVIVITILIAIFVGIVDLMLSRILSWVFR